MNGPSYGTCCGGYQLGGQGRRGSGEVTVVFVGLCSQSRRRAAFVPLDIGQMVDGALCVANILFMYTVFEKINAKMSII